MSDLSDLGLGDFGRSPKVIPNFSLRSLESILENIENTKNDIEAAVMDHTKKLQNLTAQRSVLLDHRTQVMTAIAILKKA